MAYLLDTDIFVYLTKNHREIINQIETVGRENVFLSSITLGELYYGAFHSDNVSLSLDLLNKNLEETNILNFNKSAAKIFGRLKAALRKNGNPIEDFDVAIASIALHNDYILVTHNTRHFENIPELTIEDWS
ncbi:MAG: PIN domain-containing protein [Deltaproteobacteria bacterium]|nr:PIN domain-containing protein [Deltaproteobacteria bacterium]